MTYMKYFDTIKATLTEYPLIFNAIKILLKFFCLILLINLSHYILISIYTTYCYTYSWYGALRNMLTLGSPFCHFVNYTKFELSKHYITIWSSAAIAIIAWSIAKLT